MQDRATERRKRKSLSSDCLQATIRELPFGAVSNVRDTSHVRLHDVSGGASAVAF